jgi:hypothetical protein
VCLNEAFDRSIARALLLTIRCECLNFI